MTDNTEEEQSKSHLFQKGASGNPKGRPKGARSKLAEDFIADLQADWTEGGEAAIKKARAEKPMEYVKMVASLLPKEHLVRTAPTDEMTDEELAERLDLIEAFISDATGVEGGAEPTHEGVGTA